MASGAEILHETTAGTLIFFYKHLVYKHAQPQILEKFKHIAKHAPGWDFQFEKNFGKFWKIY